MTIFWYRWPLFVIQFLLFTRPFPSSPNRAPAVHRVDSFVPAAGQSHIVGRAFSPAANRLAEQSSSGRPLAIPWQKIRRNFSVLPAGNFPGGGRKRPPYNPGQSAGCTGKCAVGKGLATPALLDGLARRISQSVGRAISPAANRLAGQSSSGLPLAIPWQKIRRNFPSCLPETSPAAGVNARPTIQGNRQAVPENARLVKALPHLPCWMVRQGGYLNL